MELKKNHCCRCGRIFTPHRRLGNRQKTCGRKECQRALNRANQKAWKEKYPDYFKGRYPNTKAWRAKNPGHQRMWRKRRHEIQNSIPPLSPMKSIRCLVPVNLLKNEIQNSILTPLAELLQEDAHDQFGC